MDATIVKLVVAGVIGAHGIGHLLGWVPAWGIARFEGMSSHSWILTPTLGDGGARMLAGLLFAVPTAGFVASVAGLLLGQPWWRQVAVGSAAVSLAATAVYPQAFPASSTIGSVGVNLAVLYAILIAGWGAETGATA
jgi:UPF0716 family protein affecting phage T7 exclusion